MQIMGQYIKAAIIHLKKPKLIEKDLFLEPVFFSNDKFYILVLKIKKRIAI